MRKVKLKALDFLFVLSAFSLPLVVPAAIDKFNSVDRAITVLESAGFSDVRVSGFGWDCPPMFFLKKTFQAIDQSGVPVSGLVCENPIFSNAKINTITRM